MNTVIAWLAFVGSWLLVAGPLNQASIELSEEDAVSRDEIAAAARTDDSEPRPSPWWWLIPPVGFWKARQRSMRQRQQAMERLNLEQTRVFVSLLDKATGWFLVASGAALIAAKETWELVEELEWPWWLFFVVYVVALVLAAGYTVARVRRSHDVIERAERRAGQD